MSKPVLDFISKRNSVRFLWCRNPPETVGMAGTLGLASLSKSSCPSKARAGFGSEDLIVPWVAIVLEQRSISDGIHTWTVALEGPSGGKGSQPRSLTTQHGHHAFHTAFGSHTPVHLCPRVALPSLPCSASKSWEKISQMLTEALTSLGPSLFSRLPVHSFWN